MVDGSVTGLGTVRSPRLRVAVRILSERSCALERAEVPRMSVPREVCGSGIGINEHPADGVQHL